MTMDTEIKRALEQHVHIRVEAILESMRARIEKNVRRTLMQEFLGEVAAVEPMSVPVPPELTPQAVTAALNAAIDPIAMLTGVQRAEDQWICVHCLRVFPSRRSASLHARNCVARAKQEAKREVSHRDGTKNIRPCIAPGCKKPSKGPRFHYLCKDHRTAKKRNIDEWRQLAKKK